MDDEQFGPDEAVQKLERLLADVDEALAPHDSIRADDTQYEDPAEWWLRPLKAQLEEAIRAVHLNR